MTETRSRIDDLYILNLNGTMYFGKCYEGYTCQKDPTHKFKHEWISGWASRIKQYTVLYRRYIKPQVKLIFDYDLDKNAVIIAAAPFDARTDDVLEKIRLALQHFTHEHADKLQESRDNVKSLLANFEDELLNLKIIPFQSKKDLTVKKRSFIKRLLCPLPGSQARLPEGNGYGAKKKKWKKERKVSLR